MKKLGLALLISATIFLVSCGDNIKTDPTGTWTANLTPTQPSGFGNATAMAFTDTFATDASQDNNVTTYTTSVTGSNLNVTTNNGCIGSDASQSATYTVDTTSNTFSLNLQSKASNDTPGNTLFLNGTLSNNVISGTWSLNPVSGLNLACTGSGTFTMNLVSGNSFVKRRGA